MNIVIVEDEILAAERLQDMIKECEPASNIRAVFDSVEDTVNFFRSSTSVDLIMLDIQLADGKSFEIFDKVNVDIPIIFTTAFNQYAIDAFKFYSIDYLLKPVQKEDLQGALYKFKRLNTSRSSQTVELQALKDLIVQNKKSYRERFIIKVGNKLHFKQSAEVAYFYADGKFVYLVNKKENRKFLIDHTLEELEQSLDPKIFFRISRKVILNIDAISEMRGLISGKLEVKLHQPSEFDLTVSRDRSVEFKNWLNQ